MTDRRAFLRWLGSLPVLGRHPPPLPSAPAGGGGSAPPSVVATPTALYQQPEGRRNLVRITVTGLDAPAGRARVTDRRGARSEEHTSELQSLAYLVCRLLLEKKKKTQTR